MSEGRDGKSTDRLFRVTGLIIGTAIVLYVLYFWHPIDIFGVRP